MDKGRERNRKRERERETPREMERGARNTYVTLLSGADMSFLRMWEGAVKCLFLLLDRSDETNLFNFILNF